MKKCIFFIVVCISTFYTYIKCSQAANFDVATPPIDKINFTPVVFENEDSKLKLAGIVFTPKDVKQDEKLPAVLVQGPMGATKEQTQSLYAQFLASMGYITMVYDYSYLGSSQGQPRGLENPQIKASDIKSAVSFIETFPNVDKNRIATVGICGSGVYIIGEAVSDNRLKAVVSVNPFTIIDEIPYDKNMIAKDKKNYKISGLVHRIDLIEDGTEGAEYYFNHKRGAAVNRVVFPTWSEPMWAEFHPTEIAKGITQPYLLVIGENAFTRPGAEKMFDNIASKDKQKIIISQARHFDMYDGENYAIPAINAINDFLQKRL